MVTEMEKKKIFIIDDDLTFLKFLKVLFEKENYYVITDRNSSTVCHKIKENRPDIVILDLLMPDNNGFQIFKQMKKDDYCSKIPVVVLTSHQNFNSKIQLLREGVLDYIYKPFRKEELLLRMKNYIHYCTDGKNQPFNEELLFNQLKEILTARKKQWIEPQLNKKSLYGYVYQDIHLLSDIPVIGKERDLLEEWAERKLLERKLVDIVELCPVCYHYNTSLNSICPICGSVDIEEIAIKNRSHSSFKCNACGLNIKTPHLRYHCLNCDEKTEKDNIVKQKIYKYQISNANHSERKQQNMPKLQEKIQKSDNKPHSSGSSIIKSPHVYYGKTDFVHTALQETNVPYVLPESLRDRFVKEIRFADYDNTQITLMSVGVENLYQLTLKLKLEVIKKIFKGILHTIVKYLRPQDVLSFNSEQRKFLVMLPNTHLKIAKIIAERIQQKLDRFQATFPLEINLASYPQDGKTADEIFVMLEMGIEKISNYTLS